MKKILAGVDEAGLGPTLGPLCTGCAALLVPDAWLPDSPWEHLADAVATRWRRSEPRLVVADSKEIYKSGGMPALEAALGAFSLSANSRRDPPVAAVAALPRNPAHPCYSLSIAPFPSFTDLAATREAERRLDQALRHTGTEVAHLEARLLTEPAMNRGFASGLNKNQVLLAETGSHLVRLAEKFPDRPIMVVVDKQGGRNAYLPFLSGLFPGAWIEELAMGAEASIYRLRRPHGDIEFAFRPKADRLSFPTALASMAAKYARERAMAELNAWFGARIPGLKPTAGYPQDARRWLAEASAAAVSETLGLELVRRTR